MGGACREPLDVGLGMAAHAGAGGDGWDTSALRTQVLDPLCSRGLRHGHHPGDTLAAAPCPRLRGSESHWERAGKRSSSEAGSGKSCATHRPGKGRNLGMKVELNLCWVEPCRAALLSSTVPLEKGLALLAGSRIRAPIPFSPVQSRSPLILFPPRYF